MIIIVASLRRKKFVEKNSVPHPFLPPVSCLTAPAHNWVYNTCHLPPLLSQHSSSLCSSSSGKHLSVFPGISRRQLMSDLAQIVRSRELTSDFVSRGILSVWAPWQVKFLQGRQDLAVHWSVIHDCHCHWLIPVTSECPAVLFVCIKYVPWSSQTWLWNVKFKMETIFSLLWVCLDCSSNHIRH